MNYITLMYLLALSSEDAICIKQNKTVKETYIIGIFVVFFWDVLVVCSDINDVRKLK